MRFVGHTRFSLFTPGSRLWLTPMRYLDDEEYKGVLFSDKRLKPRVDAFISESLPQMERGLGSHELTHVVSYSESLPDKYQQALEEAATRYPFLLLDPTPDGSKHSNPIETAMAQLELDGNSIAEGEVFVSYRIDDDDLLGSQYFDLMARHAIPAHVGWNVSLGRGVTGIRVGDNFYELRSTYHTKIAIGLAEICQMQSGEVRAPKPSSHDLVDRVNPLVVDSTAVAFFHTHHLGQDSILRHESETRQELLDKVRKTMSWRAKVTEADDLELNFPVVAHKLHVDDVPFEI